jgi:CRP-like cAMP-binding protein
MNILTDEQAAERRLALPSGGLLTGLSPDFVDDLQLAGAFVEYNQQIIVAAGAPIEYVSCIIAGQVKISRMDSNYAKAQVGTLSKGEWFGATSLFVRNPTVEEIFAEGEVIVWTMPPDTLRRMLFEERGAVQLLYNIGALLAQKLTSPSQAPVAAAAQAPR